MNCRLLSQIFETLEVLGSQIYKERAKKTDGEEKLECIAQVQKAFLEEYV